MLDRFDFEQDMMNCWHVVDDIKQLTAMVTDRNASTDNIADVLLGLQVLYNDRFTQLLDGFETLVFENFEKQVDNNVTDATWMESESDRADNIVSAEMLEQYNNLKSGNKEQKDIDNSAEYKKVNLAYNEKLLDACITVLKHYTAYSDLPEELQSDYRIEMWPAASNNE